MSEFSSLLASFKKNAAAASTSSTQRPPSRNPSSPARANQLQTRKRPHPNTTANSSFSSPSFPSFHKRKSKDFRLSFLVIGAQKAGTSWLHTLLHKCHPHGISLPREQKEVHFWDWHYRKGIDWYVRQFDFPPPKRRDNPSSSFGPNNSDNVADLPLYGEITPCYIVLPPSTIAEIHTCFPKLKIIFVARDLVDRAWSAMIMELRNQTHGLNAGEFTEGTFEQRDSQQQSKRAKKSGASATTSTISVAQQRRLQQQSSPSSQPDSYYLDRLRSTVHSSRSDYAAHLRNWYNRFPSESILIVDYRDISQNPRGLLLKIALHIGVEKAQAKKYVESLSEKDVQQRVNAATNTTTYTADPTSQHSLSERPRLRRHMENLLHPNAMKFNTLLKEQGYAWTLNEYTS